MKLPDPPPCSPVLSDASDHGQETTGSVSTPLKANTFPLDSHADQDGHAQASSQLNFDEDNITPTSYEIPHLVDSVDNADNFLNEDVEIDEDLLNAQDYSRSAPSASSIFPFEHSLSLADSLRHQPSINAPHEWPEMPGNNVTDIELPDMEMFEEDLDPEIEEVLRSDDRANPWMISYSPPPPPSRSSTSSEGSQGEFSIRLKEPSVPPDSPETLVSMFDRMTCGILSIKDGPTENPWRTLLLPMSVGVPALHHAILSMTAFHASRQDPRYRITGLRHSQMSIQHLSNHLGIMRKDTALATMLVLAFAESWDQETSTGIRHLHAARKLVTQAIANQQSVPEFDELERLKFLRNTWVYMDVIARITAIDQDDFEDLDALFNPVYGPDGLIHELDPLMGCATTFFPLLGRVAALVREIGKSSRISPRLVSKASGLRTEILKWRAPSHVQQPEDESIEIAHSVKTAEAYQWATLLFLYQAVPMIATENLADLAERILYDLVFVPTSSRLVIVHIFPLLVAGCELTFEDNRLLVEERWMSMTQRMTIGNLDRCLDVVHEVWRRRDELVRPVKPHEEHLIINGHDNATDMPPGLGGGTRKKPSSTSTHSNSNSNSSVIRPEQLRRTATDHVADIDPEMTVRGRCHWLTVMREWDWASKQILRLRSERTFFG